MQIQYNRIVDLSHPIHSDMPHWPGDPATKLEKVNDFERDGYHLHRLVIGEHSGTHVGWPSHFDFPNQEPERLVFSAVRILDDRPTTQDSIDRWESLYGPIPAYCVILYQTNWSRHWNEQAVYMQEYPGIDPQAVRWLVHERQIVGLGIDSPGIDAFDSDDHAGNTYLARHGCFHLENLTNLHLLPDRGIHLFVGALAIKGSTGSPARVLALLDSDAFPASFDKHGHHA
jgi:kynurenine formamidase